MPNRVVKGEAAREGIYQGIKNAADAVRYTLGAKGRTTVFHRATPIFSLDGATILKQLHPEGKLEEMGHLLVREDGAKKTEKEAGDGTTTTTILAESITKEGIMALKAGIDPLNMKKGMAEAVQIATDYIKDTAKPSKGHKDISNIATISSRDPEVGKLVADVLEDIGPEASVTVEEANEIGLFKEMVEGMELDNGFVSPYFITNPETAEAVVEDALVLLTTQVIQANQDIVPVLEQALAAGKPLVIIAHEIKGEALATLIINKLKGRQLTLAIKTPGLGDMRDDILEDLAILTGATVVSEATGIRMEDVQVGHCGRLSRIVADDTGGMIIGGEGDKKEINKRVELLKTLIDKQKSDYEREQLEKRAARLKGGVAVIRIGTVSETENKEMRYRIEDAVLAAKSAYEEGVVPGAGMVLHEAAQKIKTVAETIPDLAKRTGYSIVADALREPATQIIQNAGYNADAILATLKKDTGLNAETGEPCDLIKSGIIDPAKVSRCSIQNALAVATMVLGMECAVEEIEKKDEPK